MLQTCFAVRRNSGGGDEPIYLAELQDPVDTGITFSDTFLKIQAWLRANGSPEGVVKIWEGTDDPMLTRLLVSFYLAEQQVQNHSRDAIERETERRRKAAELKNKNKNKNK